MTPVIEIRLKKEHLLDVVLPDQTVIRIFADGGQVMKEVAG